MFTHHKLKVYRKALECAGSADRLSSGVDIASNLIAQAERLAIDFTEGDAEALPYADSSFDLVVSMYGVMFAPRPDLIASELLRVPPIG